MSKIYTITPLITEGKKIISESVAQQFINPQTNLNEKKKDKNSGKKAGGSTLNPFSSRMFGDQRVRQTPKDTPKTAAGRFGLNVGRGIGYYTATPVIGTGVALGSTAAGAAAGAGVGAGVGALTGNIGRGAAYGAGTGAATGYVLGAIKGTAYGARKGVALGGRLARKIATGTHKRPSEMKESKKTKSKKKDLGRGRAALGGAATGMAIGYTANALAGAAITKSIYNRMMSKGGSF